MKRYDAMQNFLNQPNARTLGVMKLIDSYYPAFAKKLFEGNPLIEKMASANFCSKDFVLYPVCGHCEALAAYYRYAKNKDGTPARKKDGKAIGVCKCLKCGGETIDPITLYEWCAIELKNKAPEDVRLDLLVVVDLIAERMSSDARRILVSAVEKEKYYVQSEEP
jgi:hypothetical protein